MIVYHYPLVFILTCSAIVRIHNHLASLSPTQIALIRIVPAGILAYRGLVYCLIQA